MSKVGPDGMLRERGDLQDWGALIEQAEAYGELTEGQRALASRGIASLRTHLGDDFLRDSFPKAHPIHWTILNQAAWTRVWMGRLGVALDFLSTSSGFEHVVRRLKFRASYGEALSVLMVALRFVECGCSVAFDDPVETPGGERNPDLRVETRGNRPLVVEITVLSDSADARRAKATSDDIFNAIFYKQRGLQWSFRIHRPMSEIHRRVVVQEVSRAVEEVNASRSFRAVSIPGVIDLGLAGESGLELLGTWADSVGLKVGHGEGPGTDGDEIRRARARLRTKKAQLPTGSPSFVMVLIANVLFDAREVPNRLHEIEEELYSHPNVSGMALCWRVLQDLRGGALGGGRHPHSALLDAETGSQSLLVCNAFAREQMDDPWRQLLGRVLQRNVMSLNEAGDPGSRIS